MIIQDGTITKEALDAAFEEVMYGKTNKPKTAICVVCGKEFEISANRKKCCSKECTAQRSAQLRNKNIIGVKKKKCIICGKEFVMEHSNQKCCSKECSAEHERQYKKRFYRERLNKGDENV